MLKILLTLDYEIHGNGEGCPAELMVEPTARMMDLFERYGAKLTIMADVAEILKFREYRDETGRDAYHYEPILAQLKDAIRRGHDVQLHLHCSYFNARHEAGRWVQDWSEYNFAGLSEQRLNEVISVGKEFLQQQLRLVDSDYRCHVFRAANWSVHPSRNVVRALLNNGFEIDTSVFKYGRRKGIVSFDYTNAFSNLRPWRAAEDDVCRKDDNSHLLEVPIYSERRWFGAFVTPQRIQRARMSRRHRLASPDQNGMARHGGGMQGKLARVIEMLTQRHAWKADFNQCSGGQLVRALERASAIHDCSGETLPFVMIGHSKLFSRYNGRNLESFLRRVSQVPTRFQFGTYSELGLAS